MQDECCLSRVEAACLAGAGRGLNGIDELRALSSNSNTTNSADPWYTVEQFEREHVIEILEKLEKCNLDDNLWGKIILMEKCRPLIEIYLRRTTVIIDGSSDDYDGITIGFNHFSAGDKDNNDIKHKIGDGVIVKIDVNGNIKAMARGLAPVIVQGWNDPISKCIPEQLIAQKGRLTTIKDRLKGITDQQRVEKIFDMRLFNLSIEEELRQSKPNVLKLLLKSCIRIALVKDVATNALKTPCWFMIVNLVALDVLRSKLPSIPRLISGALCLSTGNNIQSTITLNELFPSCRKQLSVSDSGQRSQSLPISDQIRQLMQHADVKQKEHFSTSENFISLPDDLSLSSKSSSGFSSVDLMKNFEKVESWRKNSSKFLNENSDEVLENEKMDEIPSSKHKLVRTMEEEDEWSVKTLAPEMCNSCAQQKHLMTNLIASGSNRKVENCSNNSDTYQNTNCITIIDNDNCVKQELNPESGKYFDEITNNKSKVQEKLAEEETTIPWKGQSAVAYKTTSQQFQLSDQSFNKLNEFKLFVKNKLQRNCSSMEENHTFSNQTDQNYFNPLTPKQNIEASTMKHSALVMDDEYANSSYHIYPENNSDKVFVKNTNNLYDSKKCTNISESFISDNRRSGNQNQSFAELPKVNCTREEVKRNSDMMPLYRSVYDNTKNTDDILEMDRKKIQKDTYSISQHPYANNDKTNRLKNIPSGKSLRNVQGNLCSEQSSHKSTGINNVTSRKQCLQNRLEPIASINRRKDKEEVMILPQQKMTMRKFIDVKSNQRASNIFINPIYADSGTDMNGYSSPYNISEDSTKNFNVDILHKHSTNIASTSRRQSAKALRRFI